MRRRRKNMNQTTQERNKARILAYRKRSKRAFDKHRNYKRMRRG